MRRTQSHERASWRFLLIEPNTYRNSRRFLRDRFGITTRSALIGRAFVKFDCALAIRTQTFLTRDFAVKHFENDTVAPIFIQSSKGSALMFYVGMEPSLHMKNAGDGSAVGRRCRRGDRQRGPAHRARLQGPLDLNAIWARPRLG